MTRVFAARLRVIVFAAGLAAAAGCGVPRADVTGTVSCRGRPVVYGTVSVIGQDQMTYYGTIRLDGTFTVPGVPTGVAKVGVYSPDPYFEPPIPPAVKAKVEEARRAAGVEVAPRPPKGQWFRLAPKYADPLTSGLTVTVDGQPTVVDLRLE
jgi:hypothetical protein